jgi:hypothetical protein
MLSPGHTIPANLLYKESRIGNQHVKELIAASAFRWFVYLHVSCFATGTQAVIPSGQ